MQRAPLSGGRLHGDAQRSTGPRSSSRPGDGSWPNDQKLLRGALARPPFRGDGCHTQRDLHLLCRPMLFLLTAHGGVMALLAAMQGDDHGTRLCWCGDFCRQGKPPPRHNRHCWPGQRCGRLGGTGQGKPHGSPIRHGIVSPIVGCGRYPSLSNERIGATPLRGSIVLHITRQLLKTCFPKLVRRSPRHRKVRGDRANGGQGLRLRLFTPWGARPW
jgi:hypothetical protein